MSNRVNRLFLIIILMFTFPAIAKDKPPSVSLLVANFETQSDDGKPWGVLFSRILADKLNFAPNELIRSPFSGWVANDIQRLFGADRIKTPWTRKEAIQLAQIFGIEKVLTGLVKKQGDQIILTGEIFDLLTSNTVTAFSFSEPLNGLPEALSLSALFTIEAIDLRISRSNRKYIQRHTPQNVALFKQALDAYLLPEEKANEAAAVWQEIIKQDPEFEFAYVEQANQASKDNLLASLHIAQRAHRHFPKNGRIWLLYIGFLYYNEKYQQVVEECRKFLAENPGNPRATSMLAYSYRMLEDYKLAVETIKEAASENLGHWIMQSDCAQLALQWAYKARAGRYQSKLTDEERRIFSENVRLALEKLLKAAAIYPDNGDIWTTLISGYQENGYPVYYMEQAFEKAYQLIPRNVQAFGKLLSAYTYGFSNQPERARALIKRVLTDYPDEPRFYKSGAWYWYHTTLHNPSPPPDSRQQMEWLLEKCVDLAGTDSDYAYDSVNMLKEIESYNKAYELLKKILSNPDKVPEHFKTFPHELYRLAGETARKTGDVDNAIKYYKRCLELSPCSSCYYESHLGMGRIYGQRGNYQQALKELELAIQGKPELDTAYTNYAYFAEKSGIELDKALNYANKATQLKPDKPDNWRILAAMYYKLGRADQALTSIERAIKLNPGSTYYKNLRDKYSGNK